MNGTVGGRWARLDGVGGEKSEALGVGGKVRRKGVSGSVRLCECVAGIANV